jgi:predicted enzyme related to lactoylglutathione lyase
MPRPVHFEIPADDMARATKFFREAFGWQINDQSPFPYYLADTGTEAAGINGAITARNPIQAAVTNVIQVSSIEEYLPKIEAAGGAIVHGKMPINGIGWTAYFKDTEGNIHGLFQEDPAAA